LKNQQFGSWQSIVAGVAIAIVVIFALNSFIIINPGEAGVLSILGKARDGALLEGIHIKPPFISRVDVYDVTVQKYEIPAQSATKDLQELTAKFAINFRIDPQQVVEIRRKQGRRGNYEKK
jgi:regulator of protease activity HflC (stomatin/prohibitin superfamily)